MIKRYVLSGVVAGIFVIGSALYPVRLTDTKGIKGYIESFLFNAKVYAGESDITLEDNTSSSGFSIKEGTGGRTIARFSGNGNVGIGTPSPGARLEVYGDLTEGTIARFHGGVTVGLNTPTPNHFMSLVVGERAAFDNYASLWMTPSSTPDRGWIMEVHDDGTPNNFWQVYDKVHDTPRLKIISNGNVGIGYGTTDPSYLLDVKGTIRGSNVSPSDIRWKEHVKTLDNSLEKVNKLRGVSFEWKDKTKGAGTRIGLIAQEVEKVFPEVVSEDNEGYKSVAYDKLVGALVEAIKEQQRQIEELKAEKDIEIVALKASNEALRQEISSIKEFMSTSAQAGTVPASALLGASDQR